VNSPPAPEERNNPIRIAVGNGLRADVWPEFQRRFDIPAIREFYGATEAPGAIFNVTGKVGSIGRVPVRRFTPMRLVRYDVDRDEHLRGAGGFCIECGPGEVGELIVRLKENPASPITEFKGYTDPEATRRKILEGVFEKGDRWYRSGDLLRHDDDGFFYFVDRIGDTYRWKGENVSTAEVAEVLARSPGVLEATVAGVQVPGMEGQAGLCAVVCSDGFDASGFWRTAQELPGYAQPRFVRVVERMSTTGTFKIQKTQLRHEGVDPTRLGDPLYLRTDDGYQRLTPELWREVTAGELRL
jgi:fatty-acyl-CoA synthase